MAFMQNRLGPMEAGRRAFQLMADGIKFIQKEDIIPAKGADRWVFSLAPGVVLVALPVDDRGDPAVARRLGAREALDVGIFFALAVVLGVGGRRPDGRRGLVASKFSLIGGLRGAAQLIAYEIPLFLAAAAIVLQAGDDVAGGDRRGTGGLHDLRPARALRGGPQERSASSCFFLTPPSPSSTGRPSTCRSPTPRSSPGRT